MNKKNFYFVNIITLICILTLIILYKNPLFNKNNNLFIKTKNSQARNERSTPRTFILPATPAVAFAQEKRLSIVHKKNEIQRCIIKMYDLGYKNIGNFNDYSNFKITLNLIKFQKANNLEVTGEFNIETKTLLGCI